MPPAFDVNWDAKPADVVAEIADHAERLESPCGDGTMVWHRWGGPEGNLGDRPPIILLHGGWGSWTHWIKTIPALAAHDTVYAADLPGMGDSADAPEPHTGETISAIVAEGIETVLPAGSPYHAVGFSFGGVMGAMSAARLGERCKSLTLVGAAGFAGLHFIVTGIVVPDLTLPDSEIDALHFANLQRLMFADDGKIDALALYTHRMNIARGRVRTRRISLSGALLDALPDIVSPMGGIWGVEDSTGGGNDDIIKRRDLLRQHQPDCPFDIIDGAGHWIMYETPDVFMETLLRHLRRVEA